MTDEQLICWAAGFFDGEGCVSISHGHFVRTRKSGLVSDRHSYGLHAIICQREEEPLKLFQQRFGGHLFPYQIHGNTYFRWHVWASGALGFFETIVPFSVSKKQRILAAIEFQSFKNEKNALHRGGGYPEWIHQRMESFYLQMKELNKRLINPSNPDPKPSGAKKGGRNYFRQQPEINEKGASEKLN
jgi:hypothetical protein